MNAGKLKLERRDKVLWLTLNCPEIHNAFDDTLVAELGAALESAQAEHGLRALVLTGEGASFSAGADLNWMRRMADAGEAENEQDAMRLADLMRLLNYLSIPTIARVNGSAFGGGLGLVACCDIAIAADHALFGLTELRLGLAPAVISPYVFRAIGERNARRYFLNAERFDAATALHLGLVHEVVPDDRLDDAVERQLKLILATGPKASSLCTQLVFAVAGHDSQSQRQVDEYTSKLIARLRISAEGQEGLRAFLEKRRPDWGGGNDPGGDPGDH